MKKKKEMDTRLKVGLALGVIFLLCFLIFKIIPDVTKPNYTITQEVCHNETIYIPKQCYYDKNSLYVDVIKCQEENTNIYVESQEQICENKEVDEINYPIIQIVGVVDYNESMRDYIENNLSINITNEYPQGKGYCFGEQQIIYDEDGRFRNVVCNGEIIPVKDLSYFIDFDTNTIKTITNKSISKEDLTKEWLDENAECIHAKGFDCTKTNKTHITIPDDCVPDKKTCSKYKLGNYQIEVNK